MKIDSYIIIGITDFSGAINNKISNFIIMSLIECNIETEFFDHFVSRPEVTFTLNQQINK